jgi:GNAT superfamily N-acetyltransferase
MNWEDLSLLRVEASSQFKPFNCGDEDLNDFLVSKSKAYSIELLATSFVLEDAENTIAFFSIFNDSLRVEEKDFASRSAFKRFMGDLVSHPKRHLNYFPAMKIGRLAVTNQIQKSGIGKKLLNFIIDMAIVQNKQCACKFITVDAYEASLGFYEKMGFKYLSIKDEGEDTRQMSLDITPFLNSMNG